MTPRPPTTREQVARIQDMRRGAALMLAASNVLALWDYEQQTSDEAPHPVWVKRMAALREAVEQWSG